MPTAKPKPVRKADAPDTPASKRGSSRASPATKPPSSKPAASPALIPAPKSVPVQLDAVSSEIKPASGKRKRLSKAFSRPLEKKLKQQTLVRDRFIFPENEYEQLSGLKKKAASLGRPVKKSELVRAGIRLLDALGEKELLAVLDQIPTLR